MNHKKDMLSGWRHDGAVCSRKSSNAEVLAWWNNQPIVSEQELSTPRALGYPGFVIVSDDFPVPEFSLRLGKEMALAQCVLSPPQSAGGEEFKFSVDMNQTELEGGAWFEGGNGALPKGVSLNRRTGAISGTPKEAGFAKVTIQATQRNGDVWASSCFLFVVDNDEEQL